MASFSNLLMNQSCFVACSKNGLRKSILHDLHERQGQSPYYDKICRPATELLPLLASGIKGVTSNPKIFERSILSSKAYDEQFRELAKEGKDVESAYWELVTKDIRDTSVILEPIYKETAGLDGYVSVQVSPWLADNTEETVEAAKWLHKKLGRPNVYIKIPATAESIPAIKQVISQGISVNATVIEAYLNGLESSGLSDLSAISSAAAFYISRVDAVVDAELEKIATHQALELRGKAARAQAAIAYKIFREKFSGPRWEALAKRGAKKQRLMWASTNVKNPAYPDTYYVDLLIGPETISTIPEEALGAFMDHGIVSRTLDSNMEEAESVYKGIEKLGIDWKGIGWQLEDQVLDLFKKSYDTVLYSLQHKALIY
ncbi:transaldolase-like [Cucumis melo var. makuwa]|nr:transaldolase-like [Cucumis melo var. makuwa]